MIMDNDLLNILFSIVLVVSVILCCNLDKIYKENIHLKFITLISIFFALSLYATKLSYSNLVSINPDTTLKYIDLYRIFLSSSWYIPALIVVYYVYNIYKKRT